MADSSKESAERIRRQAAVIRRAHQPLAGSYPECAVIWVAEEIRADARDYGLNWTLKQATQWLKLHGDDINSAMANAGADIVLKSLEATTRKRRVAGSKTATTPRSAGPKAATPRKRRVASQKAVATRRQRASEIGVEAWFNRH